MSDVTSPGAVTGRCHKCGEFTYAQATHECSAALELVRLREGIRAFVDVLVGIDETYQAGQRPTNAVAAVSAAARLRALLDDNEGERS